MTMSPGSRPSPKRSAAKMIGSARAHDGVVTLTISEGGAGAVHIAFDAPTIADDTKFDVMFRLVDNLTAPTNELRTGCFTVEVK